LGRISFLFTYLIFDIAGITTRSIFTDIFYIFIQVAVFTVIIGAGLRFQKRTLSSICFFKRVSFGVWGSIILCSIGFVLFYYYISCLFTSFSWEWETNLGRIESHFIFHAIYTAITPAIVEEILFKGLLFHTLQKRYSRTVSVIIVSLLFAAVHLDIVQFVPHFLFSCFTFWVYLRTGSLLLPMFIHFVNNFLLGIIIKEPFAELGIFFAALVLFIAGTYLFYKASKSDIKSDGKA
jgi:membrane protease YdiL (CAAX protease family)